MTSSLTRRQERVKADLSQSRWQRIVLLGIVGLLATYACSAHADPMTFRSAKTGGNHCCWWVAAEGEVTPDTPREFEEFMKNRPNPIPYETIRLHSPGGSLIAGLKLGYLFRQYHTFTTVSRTKSFASYDDWDDGICASACAYAFLGGVRRTLDSGARLGVHRFYKGSAADNLAAGQYSAKDLDDTQRAFAALVLYIRNMGVDPGFVGLADQAAPDQIHWVSAAEATNLQVINNLDVWSPWKIEPNGSGVIAYSQRADNKARMTLYCSRSHGRFLLLAAKEWEFRDASSLADCGPSGWHPVLGTWVANNETAALTLSDGTAAVRFRLPEAVPFSSAMFFQFDPYPMACRANFRGTTANLVQSARVALSNCIDLK